MPTPSAPGTSTWPQKLAVWLATGLGVGWIPFAPGTFGTLWGLPLTWGLQHLSVWAQMAAIVGLCVVGVPLCTVAARCIGRKDPGCVVYDEIVAMPITFFLVPLTSWQIGLAGFLLFRLFDISKVPPARQLERLPDGWGVMADDVMAAIYSNLALRLIVAYAPVAWFGS